MPGECSRLKRRRLAVLASPSAFYSSSSASTLLSIVQAAPAVLTSRPQSMAPATPTSTSSRRSAVAMDRLMPVVGESIREELGQTGDRGGISDQECRNWKDPHLAQATN